MHDELEIRRALAILVPSGIFEIRAPQARLNGHRPGTAAGYFDDPSAAAQAAARLSGTAPGVYLTLNPVDPALLARARNRLDPRAKHTTRDAEIMARRWLLLDFDPARPAGISSSHAEHEAALERAQQCRDWLALRRWPDPIYADSGNGAHLLYRIDLPNDADSKGLIEAILKTLARQFGDDVVALDTGVFNAARIGKLYGTAACKGDPVPDRPHRIARILDAPESPFPVDLGLLRALCPAPATAHPPARPAATAGIDHGGDFFAQVNAAALRALPAWVPSLLPAARSYHEGYRVSSADLGRELEEDLSILPTGIVDFGVADQGDARAGRRTPIDLVIEHGRHPDAKTAALWLCQALSIDPMTLGWKGSTHARARYGVLTNPSWSSYSAQSDTYSVILENQPVIFSINNELSLNDGKELVAESIAAQRIADELRGKLAFSSAVMTWHLFAGTHWQPVTAQTIDDLITWIFYRAAPDGFEVRYRNAVLKLLASGLLPLNRPDSEEAIPFENGILDPTTRTLHPVTPDNALPWCLPYRYDAKADCPTIKQWLHDAVDGDEATLNFLRAWLGAVLIGRPDLQKFLHLLGPGGTGKGTFIRLATRLVGERNSTITDLRNLETNRFETAALYGKRLVAITDSANYRGDVSVFKALTGQDPIRLERKHQQQSGTFTYTGMVVLASNEGLMTADFTSGLERRRLTVEFNNIPSAAARAAWDAHGGESAVLHREIPGLVNWILVLSRREVTTRIMNPPKRAVAANIEALQFSNPIADWLIQNTEPDYPTFEATVQIGDKQLLPAGGFLNSDRWLFPNYLEWCRRNARQNPISLTRFSRLIVEVARVLRMPLEKSRDPNKRFIRGLRLIETYPATGDSSTLLSRNDGFGGLHDGLHDGLVTDKWLKMLNMTAMTGESNLKSQCARAAARSNNSANEDNKVRFE